MVKKSQKTDISIVIPAYNEARRLPAYLDRVMAYCSESPRTYEIIVVDDGSSDKTIEVIDPLKARFEDFSLITSSRNRGKGHAVRRGFLKAQGEVCVFLDADGSVLPEEIEKNIHHILEKNYDILIGSRALRGEGQVLKIRWHRKFMGKVFNFFVHAFLFKKIEDPQCGFKMFKKSIVESLFARSHLQGFGFDIEILYLAHKMGYKVKEVPISWHHVDGSKVNIFTDSVKMFFNILQVRNWHYTPINTFSRYLGPDEYKYMYEMENYHWWFVSRRNLVMELIKSLKMPSPKILDVGVGTGGNLLAMEKFGETYGIDIAPQAIGFCKKRGITQVRQCPAEKIDYPDKTFDIITCLDLLEHVADPIEVLIELKRILKDRGRIIMTAAALKMLWSQHDEALCHLRRYDKVSLLREAGEAGLKVEKMGYFFFTSFFVVAPIRIMRRFFTSGYKLASDTTTLPPKPLNEFLKFLFKIEMKLIIGSGVGAPFGTTLYAVISK